MRLLRRLRVQNRLLAAFLAVSIIPAIILGLRANQTYTSLFTEELSNLAEHNALQLNDKLINDLQQYEIFINAVSVSPEVQNLLYLGHGGLEMRREVERIARRDSYFRDLLVFDRDGNILHANGHIIITSENIDVLLPSIDASSPSDNLNRISTPQGDFLTIGRKIFHFPLGREHIGYIVVLVSDELPNNILFNDSAFYDSDAILLAADGTVLAGRDASVDATIAGSVLYNQMLEAEADGKRSFTYEMDSVPSLVVLSRSETYNTYLLTLTPLRHISEGAEIVGGQLIVLVAVTILICVALSILIYRSVAFDLKKMMERHETDQRRKRELELDVLNYQINPHFLFNTLGTLKWSAVMSEASPVIVDGITSLSHLLQSVLINNNEMISLREEFENLKHYFTIQKIRYENCFETDIQIDEDVLDCLIPRLILQPLAENSVLHGSVAGERQIVIKIRAAKTQGGVELEITDNGSGFDTQTIKENKEARFSGIGLTNVDERLKLHFGLEHGLNIQSVVGMGTTCRVFIPDKPVNVPEAM